MTSNQANNRFVSLKGFFASYFSKIDENAIFAGYRHDGDDREHGVVEADTAPRLLRSRESARLKWPGHARQRSPRARLYAVERTRRRRRGR